MANEQFEYHAHEEIIHSHEHIHITHHVKGGAGQVEHLRATHIHEHNHPGLDHSHLPHENLEREHQHEAHIHDHKTPAQS